jgi:dolichol-phosphate mannosyltransferase
MTAELAVIVPTIDKRDSVRLLLERLEEVLVGTAWEVIFVDDDSRDGTADILKVLAQTHENVRVIHRIGRYGRASACIEGMLATEAPYIAAFDADPRHVEIALPEMLRVLKEGDVDVVVEGRGVDGGSRPSARLAGWLGRVITGVTLGDPWSGVFMVRRELLDRVAHRLTGRGETLVVDILASARPPARFRELTGQMRQPNAGRTKIGPLATFEFAILFLDKLFRGWLPVEFMLFVMVGLSGLVLHLALLGIFFRVIGISFIAAQIVATVMSMTSNFFINNAITFRYRRLSGVDVVRGLLTFYLACSIGAVINVTVATILFDNGLVWFLAGVSGAAVGAVWNYAMNATFTWRKRPEA